MGSRLDARPILHVDGNGNPYYGGDYFHITANGANQLVDASPTYIHRININTKGASWTITLFDGTGAGQKTVAVIDGSQWGSLEMCVQCANGLYYTTAGTTPGDVTISYSSQNSN